MKITNTLAFLIGEWKLERTIDDRLAGIQGKFSGRAQVSPADPAQAPGVPGQLSYQEAGDLNFGAQVSRASRKLLIAPLDDYAVMLYFADGKPYVDLNLTSGVWRSVHPCRADSYEITTTASSADQYTEQWRVTGPAKDYLAVTVMTRITTSIEALAPAQAFEAAELS